MSEATCFSWWSRHWSFPDPSKAKGDDEQQLEVYRRVRDEIRARLEGELLATPSP